MTAVAALSVPTTAPAPQPAVPAEKGSAAKAPAIPPRRARASQPTEFTDGVLRPGGALTAQRAEHRRIIGDVVLRQRGRLVEHFVRGRHQRFLPRGQPRLPGGKVRGVLAFPPLKHDQAGGPIADTTRVTVVTTSASAPRTSPVAATPGGWRC